MIYLGLTAKEKNEVVLNHCDNVRKVFVLSPKQWFFNCDFDNVEFIEYSDIQRYVFFYRLLQEINAHSLVVVNECLRTKNRNDLDYNCIRHYLNQAGKVIVFQYLPIIEDQEDFMTLFDFATSSKWKQEKFSKELLNEVEVKGHFHSIGLSEIKVHVSDKTKNQYQKKKKSLIDNIGLKDPHTIPRNLQLIGGKEKLKAVDPFKWHVSRNNRFKQERWQTFKSDEYPESYTVFELPHNHRDFVDFVSLSEQHEVPVITTDLKVDQWYMERYLTWAKNLEYVYSTIRQHQECTTGC